MTSKPFVFENVPELDDKEAFLTDYLEAVLDHEVEKLELLPTVPDRALVTFDDDSLDVDEANETLEQDPLKGSCLRVALAVQQNAVILDGRQYSHFETYLGTLGDGGKAVVQQILPVPGTGLVAVCISNADAVGRILTLVSQTEVKVQPFFRNFHGHIPLKGNLLSVAVEESSKRKCDEANPKKFEKSSSSFSNKPPPPVKPKPKVTISPQKENNGEIIKSPTSPSEEEVQRAPRDCSETSALKKVFSFWSNQDSKSSLTNISQDHYTSGKLSLSRETNHDSGFLISTKIKSSSVSVHEQNPNCEENERFEANYENPQDTDEGEACEEKDNYKFVEKKRVGEYKDEEENKVEERAGKKFRKEFRNAYKDEDEEAEVESDAGKGEENEDEKVVTDPTENKQKTKLFRWGGNSKPSLCTPDKEKKDVGEPKADALDLDEHIWNLIEDRLDRSKFCTLKYDKRHQILRFTSSDAETCREVIEDLKIDIIEGSPLKIPEDLKAMFVELQKKDLYLTCAKDYFERFSVLFFVQDDSVVFYGWDDKQIDQTRTEIEHRFMHSVEIDNDDGMDISHLKQEKRELESDFLIFISWNDTQASKIQIQGVLDDVSIVKQCLETSMEKFSNTTVCYEFSQKQAVYIKKHCQDMLDSILQNVAVLHLGEQDGKYVVEYSGKRNDTEGVWKALDRMNKEIREEFINVSKDFDSQTGGLLMKAIINRSPSNAFCAIQSMFEMETKCCIVNEIIEMGIPCEKKDKAKRHQSQKKELISVQTSNDVEICVKKFGNIVDENADLLVCPVHESGLLRKLRISKAFLAKDSYLQEEVEKMDFSSSPVQLCKMKMENDDDDEHAYKDVAFVSVSAWNPETPDNYLQELVTLILLKATELGTKTVAFPPLGLGVILRFPPEAIAKQYFAAIKNFADKVFTKAGLKKIEFLACDKDFHKRLLVEYKKFLTLSKSNIKEIEEIDEESEEDCTPPQINIRIIHAKDDKKVAPLWKERFSRSIVSDEFPLNSPHMPKNLDSKLKQKMMKSVIIMDKTETESGELVLKFKGLKEDILTINAFIAQEMHKATSRLVHIISEHSPPRGTLEFIEYAASIEETAPSYWTHQTKKSLGGNIFKEVEVDEETVAVIKKLFEDTYDSSASGRGNDAHGIHGNATVEFVSVKRVENIGKFKSYASARRTLFEMKVHEKELCKTIAQVSQRGQGNQLDPYLSDRMKENLCHEINECYLLHGTKPDIVDTIKRNGCDPALSNPGAMFGKGVYTAECSTKCDQYSDDPANRLPPGSLHYAFLFRVLLGDIFVCNHTHPTVQSRDCEKLKRPPCKDCLQDRCLCSNTFFYSSVMGEGKWIFREMVVYRDYMCYPEYIICYKRN